MLDFLPNRKLTGCSRVDFLSLLVYLLFSKPVYFPISVCLDDDEDNDEDYDDDDYDYDYDNDYDNDDKDDDDYDG